MNWNGLELPEPYYQDDAVYLIHGDCREVLRLLPDKSVDLVLTDPPFNVGKEFANDNLSFAEWRNFCDAFAKLLLSLTVPNILVEVSKKDVTMRQTLDSYFKYRYAICLNYTNSMRQGVIGYHNWGLVLWYGEGKCHNRYMDRIDSALHSTKNEFTHPSPKEIGHYEQLCEMFSLPKHLILDPFLGSGTTARAAKDLGRKCIGIEIEEKYCEIAAKRCSQAVMDLAEKATCQ